VSGQSAVANPASVASFVAAWDGPLDVLVNNAGVMACPQTRTPQGWELQFSTNHLGHFALATGMHRALAAAGGARIVSVSSRAHLRSPVIFDDIHFLKRAYEPWDAYAQSKTANVLFAVDSMLTEPEKAAGEVMLVCVSRSRTERLVLDL